METLQSSWSNACTVLRTKNRREKLVEGLFHGHGITSFLPRRSELRKWPDRIQTLETVLFQGDVFVQPKACQWSAFTRPCVGVACP